MATYCRSPIYLVIDTNISSSFCTKSLKNVTTNLLYFDLIHTFNIILLNSIINIFDHPKSRGEVGSYS